MDITTPSGQPVNILGIGGNPKMDRACVPLAYDAGINYFFFYDFTHRSLIEGLKPIVDTYRDNVVVATGTELRDVNAVTQYLEEIFQTLNLDMLDIFYIEYISPSEDLDELLAIDGVFDLLQTWKEKGLIRYVGATAHNRPATVELIKSGKVDVMMHRYNVAHRGAEDHRLRAARAVRLGPPGLVRLPSREPRKHRRLRQGLARGPGSWMDHSDSTAGRSPGGWGCALCRILRSRP